MQVARFSLTAVCCALLFAACATKQAPEATGTPAADTTASDTKTESGVKCADADACHRWAASMDSAGDKEMALAYYRRACERDEATCLDYHAYRAKHGDRAAALEPLEQLCSEGEGRACQSAGYALIEREPTDVERARPLFERGCELGRDMACHNLGYLHERGLLEDSDRDVAFRSYKKACDNGLMMACTNLGVMYGTEGAYHDEAKALQIFERVCKSGDTDACTDVGIRYFDGRGTEPDEQHGLRMLEDACRRGNSYGCAHYGYRLFNSAKSENARRKAVDVLRVGCNGGEARACDWAAEYALEVQESFDEEDSRELYERAYELYRDQCDNEYDGRSCAIAATLLEDGHVDRDDADLPERLYERGCRYDPRACDWR